MDQSLPITYNGLTAQPVTPTSGISRGIQFVNVNLSSIGQVGYFDKRALQDGMDAADVYLAQRNVSIDAAVYGTSKGDAWDQMSELMEAFDPINAFNADPDEDGFLAFDYYRPTADIVTWPVSAYANGIPMRMYLRPESPPTYPIPLEVSVGVNVKGMALRTSIRLVAKDPRQYLQDTTSAVVNNVSASTTLGHRGTHPVFPVLTFSMSASGSTNARFQVHTSSVRLDLSTTSSGTYTVDWSTGIITDANGDLANRLYSTALPPVFVSIKPGGSAFIRENQTGISGGRLVWREAWL